MGPVRQNVIQRGDVLNIFFSVHWCCWLGDWKDIRQVKNLCRKLQSFTFERSIQPNVELQQNTEPVNQEPNVVMSVAVVVVVVIVV